MKFLFVASSLALITAAVGSANIQPLAAVSAPLSLQCQKTNNNKHYKVQGNDLDSFRGGGGGVNLFRGRHKAVAVEPKNPVLHTLKVGFYFFLWYALNVVYNIVNKKVLNVVPAPLMIGSIQFGIGFLYVATLWTVRLRAAPTLSGDGLLAVRSVGLWHALGQLASMISLGAGPVSFTHIVKALEPFFSAIVGGVVFHKWMPPQVYATLLPVVGGVGYACLKERSFSWLAFVMAMMSNVAFALRAVLSKVAMSNVNLGRNLSSANMFGVVTAMAFVFSIPIAIAGEGEQFLKLWYKALETQDKTQLIRAIVLSGMFHYLNNEVMYLALGNVHPVTLAVGNTMKRVFIMVASVMVFRNQISLQAGIGSGVGIAGVLLYSLTKQYYERVEAEAVRKQQPNKVRKVFRRL